MLRAPVLALLASSPALAGDLTVEWSSIDGGGGTLSSANYTLTGHLGQPDTSALAASSYSLQGGFWTAIGNTLPCPADFNNDGGIDGTDVEVFFAAWESGDFSSDVNHDGGVDGADVQAFFEAWEAGGCV